MKKQYCQLEHSEIDKYGNSYRKEVSLIKWFRLLFAKEEWVGTAEESSYRIRVTLAKKQRALKREVEKRSGFFNILCYKNPLRKTYII